MRLVQILYSGLGGHGSVAFSLAKAAKDWQHDFVFFGIESLLPEYARICTENAFGCQLIQVKRGRTWVGWRHLNATLERLRPDAILLHSVKTIFPCWLYAHRHRIPLVAVEHQPNRLKSRSEWVVSRLLMKLADAVVLLTPAYRDELKSALGRSWNEDKVFLVPNGIDTEIFKPVASPPAVPPVRVGMAARFSDRKRQDLLVDTLALLKARDGAGAWRLSLAGDGEEWPRIAEKVRQLGLQDSVELPGYLGERELRTWFANLHIYAHASDGETLSTSLLQALACGLPILGSDVDGISNLLALGGGVGRTPESETPEGFADALTRLSAESDQAATLGQRARSLACSEFSHARMFERYAALLT